MKSERRHDLKTNALAQGLADFPGFMREYGSRVLLGLLVCALIVVLAMNWSRSRADRDANSREALTSARQPIDQLRNVIEQLASTPPWQMPRADVIADFRDRQSTEATKAIQIALTADDPGVRAEAHVLRGDLNHLLASLPPLPGSETKPSLNGTKSREEFLKSAQDAYSEVLKAPLNQDSISLRNARFSLASIAEDSGEWDKARQFYQQIIDDASTAQIFKDRARELLDNLPTLQKPLLLAKRVAEPEVPATLPSGPLGPALPSGAISQPSISPSTAKSNDAVNPTAAPVTP